jgi:hypothetical protein
MVGEELVALYWWEGREVAGSIPLILGDTLSPLEDHDHWISAKSLRTKKVSNH